MKKFQFLALMGAAALTGATLFSCSNDSELAEVNPNYNPATGEVTTNFVMNVNTNRSPITRMTSANTQATTTNLFRGITDAHLLTFLRNAPVADGKHVINTATAANKHYSLGNVYSTGQATTDGNKSHRILELALPTETNTLIFYGKAPKTASDGFAQGSIDYLPKVTDANATNLANYDFAVKQIVEVNASGYNQTFRNYGDLLSAALNWVLASKIENEDVQYDANGNGTIEDGVEHFPTTLSWFQFVTVTGSPTSGVTVAPATKAPADATTPMCAIGEILGNTLTEICNIRSGEVRAGSGPAVARMLGDIYVIMDNCTKTAATSLLEAKAQALATQIKTNIQAILTGTAPSMTWRHYNTIVTAIGYTGDVDGLGGASGLTALQAYPIEKFNIPAGCTQIAITEATASTDDAGWVKTPGSVKFHHIGNVRLFNAGRSTTSCYNVYYPAELCYWGDSPVRVTNDAVTEAEYPQGITQWVTEGNWWSDKHWTKDSHVVSTTRSVAMQYNINYGTAMLKSTVKYGATELYDNNHAIQVAKNKSLGPSDEPNAKLTVTDGTFTLEGILIGGVATKVGWNFLPVEGSNFNNAIYDKAIVNTAIPTSGTSEANYTLVWDNWNADLKGKCQSPVYVCLEFKNNSGKDFWGKHNIIRNEGIFYIIGKLDPNAGTLAPADPANPTAAELAAGIDWPSGDIACLPPCNDDFTTLKERRVFIQDFMTSATFVIGENSLQSAYNTVPDLRSTQISLGLNVDLQWRSGLSFNDVVLGQ
jgi:hypothetical protein